LPLRLVALNYGVGAMRLIRDVTISLSSDNKTIVLGPNGAGKSLLLRLVHGLLEPTSGLVIWDGPEAARAARYQAMVFQRPVMLRRSVRANIAYALRLRGLGRAERAARVADILARTGLSGLAERPARVLSGGEQQRVAIARAWALQPEVLFLDEPTANTDPAATRAIEELIEAVHQAGAKVIMTTHDLAQARRLADDIVFVHGGRVLEHAAANQFFTAPRSKEARAFIKGDLIW
jgi:tungstate transport system ATP-binding protein